MTIRALIAMLCFFGAVSLILTEGPAHASTTLFSDLGSGGSYGSAGLSVSGLATGVESDQSGSSFVAGATAVVSQIDVALSHVRGTTDSATVFLLTADSFGPLDGLIDSWSVAGLPQFGTCCTLQTLIPHSQYSLTSGTLYWLLIVAADTTFDAFNLNNTNTIGTNVDIASNAGGPIGTFFGTGTLGAFDVLGTSTALPEPSSVVLVGTGLLATGVIAVWRRRPSSLRRARTVSTWARRLA